MNERTSLLNTNQAYLSKTQIKQVFLGCKVFQNTGCHGTSEQVSLDERFQSYQTSNVPSASPSTVNRFCRRNMRWLQWLLSEGFRSLGLCILNGKTGQLFSIIFNMPSNADFSLLQGPFHRSWVHFLSSPSPAPMVLASSVDSKVSTPNFILTETGGAGLRSCGQPDSKISFQDSQSLVQTHLFWVIQWNTHLGTFVEVFAEVIKFPNQLTLTDDYLDGTDLIAWAL